MITGFPELVYEEKKKKEQPFDLGPNALSIDFLRACYRNNDLPLPIRMRAAMACLPFEHPKLMVAAQITENSLAELLDRRLEKIKQLQSTPVIDAKPQQVEVKPSLPRLADRRYRRF